MDKRQTTNVRFKIKISENRRETTIHYYLFIKHQKQQVIIFIYITNLRSVIIIRKAIVYTMLKLYSFIIYSYLNAHLKNYLQNLKFM